MGKKKDQEPPSSSKPSYSLSSKAAALAYGELDDFLDQIKLKIERVDRNFDKLVALGTRAKVKEER